MNMKKWMLKDHKTVDVRAMHNNEKGEGIMAQMLGALAAVLVIGIVYNIFISVTEGNKVSSHMTNLNTLGTNLERVFKTNGRANYTGISAAIITKTTAAPKDWISGTTLINEWGGAVTLGSSGVASFIIYDAGIPKANCIEVAMGGLKFYNVAVGRSPGTGARITDILTATARCSATTNTIRFTYPKI